MPLTQIRKTVVDEPDTGVVPIGAIVMYSGSIATLPSGWAFCDGTNGTPDLLNRFIIGAAADSGGQANTTVTGSTTKAGGSADAVVVSHTHGVTDPGHRHGGLYNTFTNDESGPYQVPTVSAGTKLTESATTGITVNTFGESGTNKNLPPYYALAFIMRIS